MTRKVTAVLLTLILAVNLFLLTDVYAAEVRYSANWFDRAEFDTTVLTLELKLTRPDTFGFEISAPKDLDDAENLNDKRSMGMFRVYNGEFLFRSNGLWIGIGQESQNAITHVDFEYNVINTVKIKTTKSTGLVEWYLNDEYVGQSKMTGMVYSANCISVYADSSVPAGSCSLSILSNVGMEKGVLKCSAEKIDFEEKRISLSFSDTPQNFDFVDSIVIKKVNENNGEKIIPTTVLSSGGTSLVLSYDEKLDSGSEYAIILPDGIKSEDRSVLSDNILYFSTASEEIETPTSPKVDYNNGSAEGCWFEIIGQQIVETGGDHGKAHNVTAYSSNDFQYIWNSFTPSQDAVSCVSFDILPIKENLKIGIEFRAEANVNPITIAFGENGYILAMSGWTNAGWLNLSYPFTGNNVAWFGSNLIGEYESGEWINFKVEFDKNAKTAKIYVDGTLKYTMPKSKLGSFDVLSEVAFRTAGTNATKGEQLLLLDNVSASKISKSPAMEKLRFTDAYGKQKGAFATVSRFLSKIELSYDSIMEKETFTDSTVKLMYDGREVSYSGSLSSNKKTYSIVPAEMPAKGEKIEILVDGVKNVNKENAEKYYAYAFANDETAGFDVKTLKITDSAETEASSAGGELFAKAVIVNGTNVSRELFISLSGTKNGELKKLDYIRKTIESNSVFVVNSTENRIMINSTDCDEVLLSVQYAEGLKPVTESVKIGVATDRGEDIVVSGQSDKLYKGSKISIDIFARGKGVDDIDSASDFRDVLIAKGITESNENGEFKLSFKIGYDNIKSGMYKVFINSDVYETTETILYVNQTTSQSVIEDELIPAVSGENKEELAGVILDNHFDLGVDDAYMSEEIALRAAELVLEYAKENSITAENATTVLNKAVAIASFELDELDDIMAEGERFDLENTKLKNLYKRSFVNKKTSELIKGRLDSLTFEDFEAFDKALCDAFVLSVVENPVEPNSVKDVLETFNIYGKTTAHYDYVSNNKYDTINDLKTAIQNYNPPGGSGSSSGGGGSSRKDDEHIQVEEETPTQTPTQEFVSQPYFSDIQSVDWASTAIITLAKKGIVNGKEDGRFCPLDNITREEFTKMLVNALNIDGKGKADFKDVEKGSWYAEFIDRAFSAEVVGGIGDGLFGTGRNITREDMAVMIYRAAEKAGIAFGENYNEVLFDDDAEIAEYAKEGVYALKTAGIINGKSNNSFAAKAFATRAEAAKMIYGIIGK